MATLREICDRTNLAVGTVSEILRGLPGYSEETRTRVLRVAAELDYRPNSVARALQSRRSGSIGLVFESLALPSVSLGKLAEIERRARAAGFSCLIANHYGNPGAELEAIRHLESNQVEGLVLWASDATNEDTVASLAKQTALVTIDSPFRTPTFDVSVNRRTGGMLQVRHLVQDVGCRRIAFLLQPTSEGPGAEKIRGYKEELEKLDQTLDDHFVVSLPAQMEASWETGRTAALGLMASGEPFDGIIASNDSVAVAALLALRDGGRRIPEDVAVIGFNDEPFTAHLPVPLSTIRQPPKIGEAVFQLLQEAMAKPEQGRGKPTRLHFDPELVVRGSTVRPR